MSVTHALIFLTPFLTYVFIFVVKLTKEENS